MYKFVGQDKTIRKLIYIYLLLLLFDGMLRKYVLLQFSAQVMMIKQVVAIIICIMGIPLISKMTAWEKSIVFVGILAFFSTLLFGHQNIVVAIYGCLPYWFGLPLCYIIGEKIIKNDLILFFKTILYASIVNSILIITQFNLSPSHILNFTGGEIDSDLSDMTISEYGGMFRPVGLFVHSLQSNMFMLLAFAIILHLLFCKAKIINRKLLLISVFLEILACVYSASRTCIMLHIGVLIYYIFMCMRTKSRKVIVRYVLLLIPISMALLLLPTVNNAINNIVTRFENASEVQYKNVSTIEGTIYDIVDRNIIYNINAIIAPRTMDGEDVPFMGYGQGLSTQVGGKLVSVKGGKSGFALAEWDGLRIMCESGILLGWIIIFIRLGYVFRFIPQLNEFKRKGYFLTLSLYPAFLVLFYLITTWGNIFLANFAFFSAGIFLASLKYERSFK